MATVWAAIAFQTTHAQAQEWFFASPRVIDGDTLVFSQKNRPDFEARLAGIDAVEDRQRCGAGDTEPAEWSCGLTARLFLARTIEESGFVRCRLIDQDEAGPPTAHCLTRGGNNLSYAMVEEGLALALRDAERALHAAEADARKSRRGIWQGTFEPPWERRRTNPGS